MSDSRLDRLLEILEQNPGDSFVLFAIAREYQGLGKGDLALFYYQKLEEMDPDYVGTYYHLGKYYEQQGWAEKAFDTYKKGMEIARRAGDQHAYNELAAAKLHLGDDEDFA